MPQSRAYLLVEGKNDPHVIRALCQMYQLPQTFTAETPTETEGGIELLLKELPTRLRAEGLRALGIVVDADQDVSARWQAVCARLPASDYSDMPPMPQSNGWISSQTSLPRVGVWLMPNNQLTGMLEDFVAQLIPADDRLRPKAEAIVQDIEQTGLHRYPPTQHPKAMIHTWLAWQETPGMPMGQAITARALGHNSPIALVFVEWLKRLFEL